MNVLLHFWKNLNTKLFVTIIPSPGSLPTFPEVTTVASFCVFNAYVCSHRKQITISGCCFVGGYFSHQWYT